VIFIKINIQIYLRYSVTLFNLENCIVFMYYLVVKGR